MERIEGVEVPGEVWQEEESRAGWRGVRVDACCVSIQTCYKDQTRGCAIHHDEC